MNRVLDGRVPQAQPTAPCARPFLETHRAVAGTSRALRVVVIEDAGDIRSLIRFLLETSGMDVLTIGDGRAADEMIQNWPAPDLVIMDRMLPFLAGDELIRRIREDAVWAEVPIVVVSAKARGEDVAEAMRLGADDYVTKPFSPQNLLEVIGRHV